MSKDKTRARVTNGPRYLRRYRVSPDVLFNFAPGCCFECSVNPIPEGSHIESIRVELPTSGGHYFDVMISHPDFDEVPEGSEVPLFDGPVFRQVRKNGN